MNIILKYFSDFTPKQLEQLAALEPLYREWNSRINVISRKDMDGLYEKHVLHSLSIAAVFDFKPGTEILDLGTGGGFPGIPLAIYFPQVKFHLVDSIAKKIKVVKAVAEALELQNVSTEQARAEEIKNRKFDFVVSRAVAPLKDLWKWSRPLLRYKSIVNSSRSAQFTAHDSRITIHKPGLIGLKGGHLAKEIQDSGTRPHIIELAELFREEYFREKYLLFIPR
jgi:16S rRNA (guanine527-N7)-methyltransferase